MPDDRVDEIRVHLKVARSRVLRAARKADEIHAASTHRGCMFLLEAIDDVAETNEDTDRKLRTMEAAYDADTVDIDRRERHRRRFAR